MAAVRPAFEKIIKKDYLDEFKRYLNAFHKTNLLRPIFATQRPYFGPNQVRCIHEFKRGLTYRIVHGGGNDYSMLFVVVSDPFYKNGNLMVTIRYADTGRVTDMYPEDGGITPYSYDSVFWNNWNHIEFVDGSRHMKNCCLCEKRGLN